MLMSSPTDIARAPTKADETRIDTLRWRSTPGSTTLAASPGQPPAPFPTKADEPRIDTLKWRSTPGSTTLAASPAEPPAPFPTKADETRIDTLKWRSNPGSTALTVAPTTSAGPSEGGRWHIDTPLGVSMAHRHPSLSALQSRPKPGSAPLAGTGARADRAGRDR